MILSLLLSAFSINHQPIDCVIKDRFPLVEVDVQPPADVTVVRVFFRSEKDTEFRFVPMTVVQGRFLGKLPRPKEKARAIVYYIEVTATDGTVRKTTEVSADVIKVRSACPEGGRVADEGNDDSIQIFAMSERTKKPEDFGGVERVVRERSMTPAGEVSVASAAPVAVAASPTPTTPTPSALPAPLPKPPSRADDQLDYTIGPEDILRVTVFGHDDLTQVTVVQPDGTLIYPLIGRVKAADLTAKELERKITTLLAQGYVRSPQVTVAVQEYRSKSVFVVGEVSRPGPYPIAGRMTVLELLAKAGPTAAAGAEIVIVRPKTPVQGPIVPVDVTGITTDPAVADQAEIIRVNVRDIQMGQLDKNIAVRPNDTIFVTQAARVFVTGEVRNPGPISFWSGMTVRKAVYTAGGFSPDAATGRLRVVREIEGKTKEVKIGLDDPVQPGDTILVKAKLF